MREIKFRAWDKKLKRICEVVQITFETSGHMSYLIEVNGSRGRINNEIELMQYTSLKDKNGKEIYEGDILKVTHEDGDSENYQVEYLGHQNYPAFDLVPFLECDCNGLSHVMTVCKVEIIGNIYENPDLLE